MIRLRLLSGWEHQAVTEALFPADGPPAMSEHAEVDITARTCKIAEADADLFRKVLGEYAARHAWRRQDDSDGEWAQRQARRHAAGRVLAELDKAMGLA
jgi:hypothetical protein